MILLKSYDITKKGLKRAIAMRKIGGTDVCEKCGKEYTIKSGRQKCCQECSHQDISRRASAKYYKSKKTPPAEKACAFCRVQTAVTDMG